MWTLPLLQDQKIPLYKQVIALVEQAIESGLLSGGERLPAERRLCDVLGVNRSTVIHALQDLTDRGILLRRQGSGTYVNPEKWGVQSYPILNWQPPVASRAAQKNDDHAHRVSRYRKEALRAGKPWQDLSSSDLPGGLLPAMTMPENAWPKSPLPQSPLLWGSLQDVLRQELDAESSLTGLAAFKTVVRDHLRQCLNLEVDPEQILITSGAQQALFLITQCLLRPGDAVGIEAPSYFYSLPVFQAAGLRLFAIPTDNEGVSPEGLDAVVSRRELKMIFLNPVFQNPTGLVMSSQRKQDILQYCAARHIPIVEDDAYSLLDFSPAVDIAPIKSWDRHGQVLYIGSLSSYVGKNIRAGWMVAPQGVVQRLAQVRQQIDSGVSILPQLLAGQYLQIDGEKHRRFLQATLARKAAAVQQWLTRAMPGAFTWTPPLGGFYLYLRANPEMGKTLTPGLRKDLLEELLRHGIVPALGSHFGDAGGRLRLNYAHAHDFFAQ